MTTGLVILGAEDKLLEAGARRLRLECGYSDTPILLYDKTLLVQSGTRVPWDLLPAAWHFLERWDAAVPLWRYGVTAADVGSKEERKATALLVRDLRVLLHSVELLFLRKNEGGQALVAAYATELATGGEPRLAFLRAYYRIKPRLCVLPISWMAELQARSQQDAKARVRQKAAKKSGRIVKVEIAPGRFIKCFEGDEDKVRATYFAGQRRNVR